MGNYQTKNIKVKEFEEFEKEFLLNISSIQTSLNEYPVFTRQSSLPSILYINNQSPSI